MTPNAPDDMNDARAAPVLPTARRLAELALRADPGTMHDSVRRKAGTCLLDFLAACASGASLDWSRMAVEAAKADGGAGPCAILSEGSRVGVGAAAFANAVLGGATWQMDTFADSATHPGVMVIPAALASAQSRGAGGEALLAGVVGAYEVVGALGEAMYRGATSYTMRPSAVIGPIAAAAAAARVHGLSLDATANAIALATNASGGLLEGPRVGNYDIQFHAAFGARGGLAACDLARAGAPGAPSAIEGPAGLIASIAPGALGRGYADEPGARRILQVLHKPAPACVYVQTPCQIAASIASRPGFDAARIRSARVRMHPMAIGFPGCDNAARIDSAQAARLSIQYSVASVLLRGAIDTRIWTEPDAGEPVMAAMAACTLEPREALPVQGCAMTVTLDDGREFDGAADAIRAPTHDDIVERFTRAAAPRLGDAAVRRVIGWAQALETLSNVDALVDAFTGRPRGPG